MLYTSMALANPTGMAPVAGNVTPDGASTPQNMILNILGKGAVINWDAFSILSGEKVRFQMDSSAAVLNRVVGNDLSRIAGTLESNGKVFLVNPHGIAFANGVTINAPLFVASTLDVNNDRFMAYAEGSAATLPFVGSGSGEIRVEGNTNIGTSAVALLGNTVTVAPGVTFTSDVNNSGSPTGGTITAVAAEKADFYEPLPKKIAVAFQAQANNAVNVGDAVSGGATVQAERIFLGGGAVNLSGTQEKSTEVHSGSETLAIMALTDYNFAQAGVSTAVAAKDDLDLGNVVSLQNANVGTAQSGGTYTATPNANLVIFGGSVKALGSTLGSGANTVLVAASTFNKAELKTQDERNNTLTLDVENESGNTIKLGNAANVKGKEISMSAYNIDMMGANVESYQGNISLLAGKKLQGVFAPREDSFKAEAERENGIVIGNSKVSTNSNGTSSYLRILGAGGKIVLHQQSEVVSDNEKNVNQGGVGLVAYSKLAQQSDGTSVYLNGQYESRGGAEQNYVKLQEASSITAGDISLVGNAIKNGGTLTAKSYLGASLEAATTISQNNTQQTRVATITADNKITNTFDGFNGNITSDIGDIMVTGYGIENNGSIHSDSGTVAVMALDKVSGSGTVVPGTGTTHVISGAAVTERKEWEFNTREADGSTGQVITKPSKLIIDPTNKPLTTVTMEWHTLDKQGDTLNWATISGNPAGSVPEQPTPGVVPPGTSGSVPEQPIPGVVPPGTSGSVPEQPTPGVVPPGTSGSVPGQPAPGVVPPGTSGSVPEQPMPGVVPSGASMEVLKRALEAANMASNMEAKKELLAIIFTTMNPHEYQEAIHYLLDLQNGPGTFVRGQNQSRQGLLRENQQQQARQMRGWDQMRLGSALEALKNKSKDSLFMAPGVSFSPMPRGPERLVAPPQHLPQQGNHHEAEKRGPEIPPAS